MSNGKTRLDLIPFGAVRQIADVLAFGAEKYEAHNWCNGMEWSRVYAALLRHVTAWWEGEDLDAETGLSHLAHAGCCLMFLLEYERNGWGTDDRFRGPSTSQAIKHDGRQSEEKPRPWGYQMTKSASGRIEIKALYPTEGQSIDELVASGATVEDLVASGALALQQEVDPAPRRCCSVGPDGERQCAEAPATAVLDDDDGLG